MSRKRKIIITLVCGFITVFTVAALMISYYGVGRQVADGLLHCNKGADTKNNCREALKQWNYDLNSFENTWEKTSFSVPSKDGTIIYAADYQPGTEDAAGTVILIHGLGGDHVSMTPLTEMYLKNGYIVYAMDQRGSGQSENPLVSFGYLEKEDVAALVSVAKEQNPSLPVIVHGQSMGAATSALYAATTHGQENLDALVLDSTFDSMESMFLGSAELNGAIGDYFILCGDWYLRRNYGFGFADVNVVDKASHIKSPTLVIQCTRDEIAPVDVGKAIYDNIDNDNKAYWESDSLHIEAFIDNPQDYEANVSALLGKQ